MEPATVNQSNVHQYGGDPQPGLNQGGLASQCCDRSRRKEGPQVLGLLQRIRVGAELFGNLFANALLDMGDYILANRPA